MDSLSTSNSFGLVFGEGRGQVGSVPPKPLLSGERTQAVLGSSEVGRGQVILFQGVRGSGRTAVVTAMACEMAAKGASVAYVTFLLDPVGVAWRIGQQQQRLKVRQDTFHVMRDGNPDICLNMALEAAYEYDVVVVDTIEQYLVFPSEQVKHSQMSTLVSVLNESAKKTNTLFLVTTSPYSLVSKEVQPRHCFGLTTGIGNSIFCIDARTKKKVKAFYLISEPLGLEVGIDD